MTNDILNDINSQQSDTSSVELPELTSEQKQLLRQQLLQEILQTRELTGTSNNGTTNSFTTTPSSTIDTTSSTVVNSTATSSSSSTTVAVDSTPTTDGIIIPSDSSATSTTPMHQAASTLVQHVGDFITKNGSFEAPPAALVVEDLQQIWKAKTSDHTVTSTVSTLWESVTQSEHLPTIAGMLASIFVKKP